MRCLAHIALVTVIQFIACYLAGWENAETIFMLFFIVLWQGLFIWLFSQIRKKRNVSDEFKFSKGVWYITMPVSSLLSPLLSLMVFIIGTLYELRRVSGCVSVREWMQSQVNEQTGFAPIFPDTCYHLTHYWPAAADIPVASDNPLH